MKTDIEKLNLFGRVNQVKQNSCCYDMSEIEIMKTLMSSIGIDDNSDKIVQDIKICSSEHPNYLTVFNERGNKIEERYFNADDSLKFKYIFKYDDKWYNIETTSYHDDGTIRSKDIYQYDEKGNLIEEISYQRILKEYVGLRYNHKKTYKYDDNGNMIEEYFIGPSDFFNKITTYQYDEKGNRINVHERDRFTYRYDDKGNVIECIYYDIAGGSTKRIYKYDNYGNVVQHDFGINKYEYDKQCNWIKKIEFKNDDIKYITTREITYYE